MKSEYDNCAERVGLVSAFAYEIAYSAGTLFGTCFLYRLFDREEQRDVMDQ